MFKSVLERIPIFKRDVLAGDIMTRKPVTVVLQTSAQDIAKMMSKKRVGTVIVIQGGKPVGIVTDTDLTKRIVAGAKNPKKLKAKDIMTTPLIYSPPSTKVGDVVSKMKKHRIKRIPIIEKGKLLGILTTTDIARSTPEMMDLLEARLLMREEQPLLAEEGTSGVCESCGNYSENLTYQNEQWVCEECRE